MLPLCFNKVNFGKIENTGTNFNATFDVNKSIATIAIQIRKNKQKRIKLPDAIILATAKFLNLPLLTDDWDDFSNIDETILISNIDFLKI